MSGTEFRRKDLKQQDEFLSVATRVTHWVMQRRRTLGLALFIVIGIVSVLIGLWTYRQRGEQNAAAQLAVALQVVQAEVRADGEGTDTENVALTPARATFPSAEAKHEAAVAALAAVVEGYDGYPSGLLASYYLGISLAELGRADEAIVALERARGASVPMLRAMAGYRLGELYLAEGRHEDAIAAFDRVADARPGAFPIEEALAAKARAHEAAGDRQAAMLAYQRITEDHPTSVYAARARERAEAIAAELGIDLDVESD